MDGRVANGHYVHWIVGGFDQRLLDDRRRIPGNLGNGAVQGAREWYGVKLP